MKKSKIVALIILFMIIAFVFVIGYPYSLLFLLIPLYIILNLPVQLDVLGFIILVVIAVLWFRKRNSHSRGH